MSALKGSHNLSIRGKVSTAFRGGNLWKETSCWERQDTGNWRDGVVLDEGQEEQRWYRQKGKHEHRHGDEKTQCDHHLQWTFQFAHCPAFIEHLLCASPRWPHHFGEGVVI